jgi:hypothetical protein
MASSTKGRIELELRAVSQLFNSMDPSPLRDKDLRQDVEEFIVSWAWEFPVRTPLSLTIHLVEMPPSDPAPMLQEAVQNYFSYRAGLTGLEFRRLMATGRLSLAIGLAFLAACFVASNALRNLATGPVTNFVRESLTIAGWVAMWRPVQIYLHDWWPLWRRGRIFAKLSRMPVTVVHKPGPVGDRLPGRK